MSTWWSSIILNLECANPPTVPSSPLGLRNHLHFFFLSEMLGLTNKIVALEMILARIFPYGKGWTIKERSPKLLPAAMIISIPITVPDAGRSKKDSPGGLSNFWLRKLGSASSEGEPVVDTDVTVTLMRDPINIDPKIWENLTTKRRGSNLEILICEISRLHGLHSAGTTPYGKSHLAPDNLDKLRNHLLRLLIGTSWERGGRLVPHMNDLIRGAKVQLGAAVITLSGNYLIDDELDLISLFGTDQNGKVQPYIVEILALLAKKF